METLLYFARHLDVKFGEYFKKAQREMGQGKAVTFTDRRELQEYLTGGCLAARLPACLLIQRPALRGMCGRSGRVARCGCVLVAAATHLGSAGAACVVSLPHAAACCASTPPAGKTDRSEHIQLVVPALEASAGRRQHAKWWQGLRFAGLACSCVGCAECDVHLRVAAHLWCSCL